MDPSEVEFLAEKEMIAIVPNFSQDKIYLIGGEVGPFDPGLQLEVPLWMAVNLKQRQKCRIIPPAWMDPELLENKKQEEQQGPFFTEMPSTHYMEITQLLLQHASDNIPHADQIRTVIKDIWDLRMAKLRTSIDKFARSSSSHATLTYLTLMELNTIRPFLTKALDHMQQLRKNVSHGAAIRATQD